MNIDCFIKPWIRAVGLLFALTSLPGAVDARTSDRPPNVVIVFADDLGYADLGCFGSKTNPTPCLDRMAAEGIRLTSFYVPQAVCSASRVALLTGCYPNRVGILGALGPKSTIGVSSEETLLSEVFRSRGYATAIFGKWHLGHHPQFLPTRHGFDDYFGLPYSNDMWPRHPTNGADYPDLPLIEGEAVKALNPDQTKLTAWYTERAVAFIENCRDRPFFLYVPHSMPHVPLFASARFEGKTGAGLYADVIAEIDDSVGRILDTLQKCGLDDQTLVIFSSDNGPWLSYGNHAGSAGFWREGKATSFEGGVRVPFIARWPGKIPAGTTTDEPAMTIDLLPTLAGWIGADRPSKPIDGRDISPLLRGVAGAVSPHEALLFYWDEELQAIRSGRWKLHFPHEYRSMAGQEPGRDGQPGRYITRRIDRVLYDLMADPGESIDVAAFHPEVVRKLEALAERARADLGDSATRRVGRGVRSPGRL